MACCLVGIAASAVWHGSHVHRGPLIGAFGFSIVAAVSTAWQHQRRRMRVEAQSLHPKGLVPAACQNGAETGDMEL